MDLRFWVRLCAISLFLFSVALLVLSANGLRIYRISQDDLSASLALVADLFNETGTPDVVVVPFATWNQININLYAVEDRWNTQVALAIAGITIICLCFGFQIAILLLPYRQKGEQLSLLSRTAVPNYQNPNSYGSLPRTGPPNESSKKLAMMCEGALYEPWNQATLDKLSSEEAPPATKITRAIYRYGPIAGKILMRRFGHMLSDAELSEVERILNFGQDVNGAPNLNLNFPTAGSPNLRGRDPATSNLVNSNNNNNNNNIGISTPPSSPMNR